MEILFTAIIIIGAVYLLSRLSQALYKSTGKTLGEWFGELVMRIVVIPIGFGIIYGAFLLIRWAMSYEPAPPLLRILVVIVSIISIFLTAIFIKFLLTKESFDSDSGYDPMSGKKTIYNKDGKPTGYFDRD